MLPETFVAVEFVELAPRVNTTLLVKMLTFSNGKTYTEILETNASHKKCCKADDKCKGEITEWSFSSNHSTYHTIVLGKYCR